MRVVELKYNTEVPDSPGWDFQILEETVVSDIPKARRWKVAVHRKEGAPQQGKLLSNRFMLREWKDFVSSFGLWVTEMHTTRETTERTRYRQWIHLTCTVEMMVMRNGQN